ncbi:MAG: DUF4345 family protein [Chromatocurvus sp.]
MGKFVLYLAGATFTAYGLTCLFKPDIAAAAASLSMQNSDAVAEVGAMYGGFQTGFGLFCLLAAWKPEYRRAGLWALLLGIGLLAAGRSYHAITASGDLSAYTLGAIAFESVITLLAALALRRRGSADPAH